MNKEAGKERPLWLMFIIGYIGYSCIYIGRLNFSIASAFFEAAGTLTKTQIGIIGSIFSLTYAIGKVPNGYIGDRFSSRAVIVCGLLITAVTNLLIGFMPVFWSIAILWGMNAYGQSMLWGPMLRSYSEHYTRQQYNRLIQYLVSAVAAGSILGLLIASFSANKWGVAAGFFVPGIISLLAAALIRFFFIDSPGQKAEKGQGFFTSLLGLTKNPDFMRMVIPAMSHGMIKDNINVWLAVYFVDAYGLDISTMAWYIFFIPAFALIGRFVFPVLYRVFKDEYKVTTCSFVLLIAVNMLLFTGKLNVWAALFCLGADSALVSVINSHVLSIFPTSIAKSGSLSFTASVMDLITYGGAGIGSLVFGALISRYGYGSMFLVWAAASAISVGFMARFLILRRGNGSSV